MIKDLIYDVGMNRGEDTAFYLSQGYRVVAVEADQMSVEKAKRRFESEIKEERLHIVGAAVAREAGLAEFYICESQREWNSFDKQVASRDGCKWHSTIIPTIRFDTILEKYGIPLFLKIDIEGNDIFCLDTLRKWEKPAFISIESECIGSETFVSEDKGLQSLILLKELGYSRFKLIDQTTFCPLLSRPKISNIFDRVSNWMDQKEMASRMWLFHKVIKYLTVRRRLQRRFKWFFPLGSSGVWGEYTQGPWMSFNSACKAYRLHRKNHFTTHGMVKPYSFWCDWHAAK